MTGSNVTDSLSLAPSLYSYRALPVCAVLEKHLDCWIASLLTLLLIFAEKGHFIFLLLSIHQLRRLKKAIMTGQDHDKLAAEEIYPVRNPLQKHCVVC